MENALNASVSPILARCGAGLSGMSAGRALPAVGCRCELESMAAVQEEIKLIGILAESISMTATNALLVAKRAGTLSVGFTVVARELRRFAENLGVGMEGLSRGVCGLVGAVALKMQRERQMAKLCAACMEGSRAQHWIGAACNRSRGELLAHVELLAVLQQSLSVDLVRAEKQCVMGMAVGRAARIEAAYGGIHQPVLCQIAGDVEDAISGILARIRKLKVMLD